MLCVTLRMGAELFLFDFNQKAGYVLGQAAADCLLAGPPSPKTVWVPLWRSRETDLFETEAIPRPAAGAGYFAPLLAIRADRRSHVNPALMLLP